MATNLSCPQVGYGQAYQSISQDNTTVAGVQNHTHGEVAAYPIEAVVEICHRIGVVNAGNCRCLDLDGDNTTIGSLDDGVDLEPLAVA